MAKENVEQKVTAKCNLEQLLKDRGRSLLNFSKAIGKSYRHLRAQQTGQRESIDYEAIAKICVELNCGVEDLIVFDPPDWRERLKKKQK